MNILVTGANGQLGTHIRLLASNTSTNHWLFTDIETLDITSEESVARFVDSQSIDCVINCAAYTNVDAAEDAEPEADNVNRLAVKILASSMAKRGGFMLHVSTDYVFGGNLYNTPCNEQAVVNPLGVYGRTKLAGEQALISSNCPHIIIRTAWLYSEYGHNFVKTMLSLMSSHENLSVVYDQVGTPTYAGDLAKAIFNIIETKHFETHCGLYNFSNEGVCSWYDFAQAIAQMSGSKCHILPCRSSEYRSKVVRPSYSVLDKTKIKTTFGIEIPYWLTSLKLCLENISIK